MSFFNFLPVGFVVFWRVLSYLKRVMTIPTVETESQKPNIYICFIDLFIYEYSYNQIHSLNTLTFPIPSISNSKFCWILLDWGLHWQTDYALHGFRHTNKSRVPQFGCWVPIWVRKDPSKLLMGVGGCFCCPSFQGLKKCDLLLFV